MNSLTSAVERIGRAGSENSRATEKLRGACKQLANYICDDVLGEREIEIPYKQGFEKYQVQAGSRFAFLAMEITVENFGSFFRSSHAWGREECLAFSRDVANGLLTHIAEWLENRTAEADAAAAAVEAVTPE